MLFDAAAPIKPQMAFFDPPLPYSTTCHLMSFLSPYIDAEHQKLQFQPMCEFTFTYIGTLILRSHAGKLVELSFFGSGNSRVILSGPNEIQRSTHWVTEMNTEKFWVSQFPSLFQPTSFPFPSDALYEWPQWKFTISSLDNAVGKW